MCTAITYEASNHYFGRNLDLEYHYDESIVIAPRSFPFSYRQHACDKDHHAMIGVATVIDGYPLYYDAANEYGLAVAGLNFVGNAVYHEPQKDRDNITPFELIPWILTRCKNVSEAKKALAQINLTKIPFSDSLPLAELHWIIADKNEAITVEPLITGLKIHDNNVGVLTNNPPFDFHIQNLTRYLHLSADEVQNTFSDKIELQPYGRGMGTVGLPGDLSSPSRFVRAAFVSLNAAKAKDEALALSQFFHILASVEQTEGCVRLGGGRLDRTQYSSCCNIDKGIFYYKTYTNSQISAVDLFSEELDADTLISYPLVWEQQIRWENENLV